MIYNQYLPKIRNSKFTKLKLVILHHKIVTARERGSWHLFLIFDLGRMV